MHTKHTLKFILTIVTASPDKISYDVLYGKVELLSFTSNFNPRQLITLNNSYFS